MAAYRSMLEISEAFYPQNTKERRLNYVMQHPELFGRWVVINALCGYECAVDECGVRNIY